MSGPSLTELRALGQPDSVTGRLNEEHWAGRLYMRDLSPYGTWLFALYAALRDDASACPDDVIAVARDVADYVAASWRLPCYDYWEESPDRVHTSTLAALAAGLRAAAQALGDDCYDATAAEVMDFITARCVSAGAFVKGTADTRVDGSLLSLAVPFGLVPLDDPHFVATLHRIRTELASPSGGIRRYRGDDYYGGSPWLLLTAWLGWCDRLRGDTAGFERARDWVRRQAGPSGSLPEQVVAEPQLPDAVPVWERRWGPVADPLLWSHAKYVLLVSDQAAMSWN